MMYEYFKDNLKCLMQTVGVLNRQQLLRFFSDTMPESRIKYWLERMVLANMLDYDEKTDRYSWRGYCKLNKELTDRRITAFWVLANWGSSKITTVEVLAYPQQYWVITSENVSYDIAVCKTTNDASLVMNKLRLQSVKGESDETIHIAIVPNDTIGAEMQNYGFDCYCILNPLTHEAAYTTIDS